MILEERIGRTFIHYDSVPELEDLQSKSRAE
jgi:hypothetical protein